MAAHTTGSADGNGLSLDCIGTLGCPCPGFTPWRTTVIERTVTHG